MKFLPLLILSFFLVSCTDTDVVTIEDNSTVDIVDVETDVLEVQTERVKSEKELAYPERFDPIT
jgi:hypothetical protein